MASGFDAYSAVGMDGSLDHFDFDRSGIVVSAIGANCGQTWLAYGKWSCIKNTIKMWSTNSDICDEYLYLATSCPSHFTERHLERLCALLLHALLDNDV